MFIEFYIVITIYRISDGMGEREGNLFGSHSGSGLCGGCSRGKMYLHCTRPQSTLVLRRLTGSEQLVQCTYTVQDPIVH